MNNSTPTLGRNTLLINQLELVSPTTVAGTFYGIAFTIFCLYVHSLVPRLRDEDRKGQAKFMLVYNAVIMLCGLYSLVSNAWSAQNAYINHGSYPRGPYGYVLSTLRTPLIVVAFICQMAVDILTSAIQVWRVWVVWSATRYAKLVIVLPMLCFFTFTILTIRTIILEAALPLAKVAPLVAKTDIAEVAIQGATTTLCTMLISLLLIFQQWRQRRLIGKAQGSAGYMQIVAVLIESYALESMWLLISATLQSVNVVGAFFIETQAYIEIIAYLLVQYRVASGKAYESQRGQTNISSLHWNRSNHAAMQFEAENEPGHDRRVFVKPKASSDALPASDIA